MRSAGVDIVRVELTKDGKIVIITAPATEPSQAEGTNGTASEAAQIRSRLFDRHGKPRHYLRRPGRREAPLPGMPWSTDSWRPTSSFIRAAPVVIGAKRSVPGTVAEAVARYLASAALAALAPSTQAMRRAILQRFRDEHGDKRLRKLQPEHVARLISKLRPYAQRNMRKTLRGLMSFALAEGLIDVDPSTDVKLVPVKDTGGFETWPVGPSNNIAPVISSARGRGSPSNCSTARCNGAVMWFCSAGSMCTPNCSRTVVKKTGKPRWIFPCFPNFRAATRCHA